MLLVTYYTFNYADITSRALKETLEFTGVQLIAVLVILPEMS